MDPKHFLFTLSRYKFVAKMLAGREAVLEIGCGDAMGTRLVQQTVGKMTAVDFDPIYIDDIQDRADTDWPMESFVHDIIEKSVPGKFDAIYSLDVLEHIAPDKEDKFLTNVLNSLSSSGVFLVGIPSLSSQQHARPQSREGHVNCKDGDDFKAAMGKWFDNVFLFSMNDEVVHTGFSPMAHYLFALCTAKRR
jgi:cyclopropane fatty-acyl-phospholipid synthase-like methyltransferase